MKFAQGDLVLVKGSRSVETDKVVKALKERFPLAGERVVTVSGQLSRCQLQRPIARVTTNH